MLWHYIALAGIQNIINFIISKPSFIIYHFLIVSEYTAR